MNTKTIRELRTIGKDKGLHEFYKLKKDALLALLLEQSSEEMTTPLPRARGKEKRRALPVKITPSPPKTNEFEQEKMKKSRSVVESTLSRLHKWLDDYVPKPI